MWEDEYMKNSPTSQRDCAQLQTLSPSSTDPAWAVIEGNALDILKTLPSNSAHMVLTDPPYFIDGMGSDWNLGALRKRVKPGVVGGIPCGQKFDTRQGANLQAFIEPIAKEALRVLTPGAFFLCFSQARLTHRMAIGIEDAGFEIRDLLAWQYEGQAKAFTQNHFVEARSDLSQAEKQAIIADMDGRKTPQLKPQMETIIMAQAPREGTYVDNWCKWGVGLVDFSKPVLGDKFPGTVIPCRKPRERYNHMTVKPVDVCRHLIRLFAPKEGLVLDMFSGTGTTGIAALAENKRFLGIEIDPEMVVVSQQRIKQFSATITYSN